MRVEAMSCECVPQPAENVITPARTASLLTQLRKLWQKLLTISCRPPRRLRLCESLAFVDKRFVAVIEFEGARFLVGGTAASLVLLERLDKPGAGSGADSTPERSFAQGEESR